MTLRQLRYFMKVIETGNMTRAAEQLHVAQPALGTQIRQLEEDLGVALIVRHSRGIEPTKSGSMLYERASAILKLVADSRADVAASNSDANEVVRLGITPTLMPLLGPDIAINVRERVPQVALKLVEEMSHVQVKALTNGQLDAALAYDVPDMAEIMRTAVYQEDLVLVTQAAQRKDQAIALTDALEESLVLPEAGDSVRTHIEKAARELGLELRIAYEVRSIAAIRSLVARGAAAGILPYASVADDVQKGRLDAQVIVSPTIRRTLFVAYSRKPDLPRNELALTGIIRTALHALSPVLGTLGHPLLPDEA